MTKPVHVQLDAELSDALRTALQGTRIKPTEVVRVAVWDLLGEAYATGGHQEAMRHIIDKCTRTHTRRRTALGLL